MRPDSIECLECGGEGHHDSGGVTPWGAWISVPCGRCDGNGKVPVAELTDEELRFIATSPVCLAAPALLDACEAVVHHIDEDHWLLRKQVMGAIALATGKDTDTEDDRPRSERP